MNYLQQKISGYRMRSTQKMLRRAAASLFVCVLLMLPMVIHAVSFSNGLVNCEGALTPEEQAQGVKKCDFNALIGEIQYLIDWMIGIGGIIATGVFAYAGILFMSNSEKNITQAKGMFGKVVWGFVIMLSAWVIVHTVVKALSDKSYVTSLLGS